MMSCILFLSKTWQPKEKIVHAACLSYSFEVVSAVNMFLTLICYKLN